VAGINTYKKLSGIYMYEYATSGNSLKIADFLDY